MRRARFLLLILVSIVFIYFVIPYEWFGPRPRGIKYFYEKDRPAIFLHACQFIGIPLEGDEAGLHSEHFKLRGIMTIFRHGERSPINKVKDRPAPDCTPFADADRKAFDGYTKLLKTLDFKNFLKVDQKYSKFKWHPHPYRCEYGQMSAEGALQLLKLGTFLHEKYKSAELFTSIHKADILVSSSLFPRTFQSAIAFLSTFLYTLPDLKQLTLIASNTTYFCLDSDCKCPKYDETRLLSESERVEEFLTRSPKKLFYRAQTLGQIAGLQHVDHPLQLQDVMLGRYICRRNTLPCNAEDECFTVNDFLEISDESWSIAKRMFEKTSPATRSMALIEAWTLFRHLKNATTSARRSARGRKIIKILSGHDITLEALMHTLGIKHRMPPPYSSRLVFELYETLRPYNGETIFVRLMFNGVDHTEDVEFCKPLVNGMCRASVLEDFADKGILKLQNVDNIQCLCK